MRRLSGATTAPTKSTAQRSALKTAPYQMKSQTPTTGGLFLFLQRKKRLEIWQPDTERERTAAQLQILADAQKQMRANLTRQR